MTKPLRVLLVTNDYPSPRQPQRAPFIALEVKFLRQAGIDVDVFHFDGLKNPLNYWRAWCRVRGKLRRSTYDLIHAQFGQSGVVGLPKRLPLVVTFQGSDLEGIIGPHGHHTLQGKVLRNLSRMVGLLADETIVVSASLGKRLPRRCAYHIIPGGLDFDLFKPLPKHESRAALNLPQDRSLVLFAGKPHVARKRHDLARQAVALLQDRYDVELVVTEDVAHDVVPTYMSACDALLLTSIHEGSPNVVKEALACNLPVVSVDVGDVRERISNVPGCVLCEDDRAETIAAGLEEVLNRKAPFNGRDAVQDLDERVVAAKVIDVYYRAMQRRGKQGKNA